MKHLLLSFVLFCSVPVSAQSWQWAFPYGDANHQDAADVAADRFGNIYMVGRQDMYDFYGFISRYDTSGTLLWTIVPTGSADFLSVCTDKEGYVYVCGHLRGSVTLDTVSRTSLSGDDMLLAKLDSLGNVLWIRNAGSSLYYSNSFGSAVCTDPYGNVYVGGSFIAPDLDFGPFSVNNLYLGAPSYHRDLFVAKYDKHGNALWAKAAGGNYYANAISHYSAGATDVQDIIADSWGDVYVTGNFEPDSIRFDAIRLNQVYIGHSAADLLLAKFDGSGNVLWAKSIGDTNSVVGLSLALDPNDDLFVGGYFYCEDLVVGTDALPGPGGVMAAGTGSYKESTLLFKVDPAGTVQWARSFPHYTTAMLRTIASDRYGTVYATGALYDTLPLTDNTLMMRYDNDGNLLSYEVEGGAGNRGVSVCADRFDGVFVAGAYFRDSILLPPFELDQIGGTDVFLARYISSPVPWSPSLTSADEYEGDDDINVFPLPSSGVFTVDVGKEFLEGKMKVYDLRGRCLVEKGRISSRTRLDLGEQAAGFYFLEIENEDSRWVKKLLIN